MVALVNSVSSILLPKDLSFKGGTNYYRDYRVTEIVEFIGDLIEVLQET